MAIHPLLLYYETVVQTEVLFLFLFLLALVYSLKLLSAPSFRNAVFAALSLVLAILTRPVAQFLILFSAFFSAITDWTRKRTVKYAAVFLALSCLLLVPWMEVNRESYGFFGVTKGQGVNLFLTTFEVYNLPAPTGIDSRLNELFESLRGSDTAANPDAPKETYFYIFAKLYPGGHYARIKADREMFDYALEAVKEHPGLFMTGVIEMLPHFFADTKNSIDFCDGPQGPYLCSNHVINKEMIPITSLGKPDHQWLKRTLRRLFGLERIKESLIAVLALIGLVIALCRSTDEKRMQLVFLCGVVAYFALTTVMFNVTNDRYRLPVDPILFAFAASAILAGYDRCTHYWK